MKKVAYQKENIRVTMNMAWPSIIESFFVAFAGLIDSLMVSSLGSYAVAAIGLTTQPKFMGLSLFFAVNVAISALVARRRGEQKQEDAKQHPKVHPRIITFKKSLISDIVSQNQTDKNTDTISR